LSPLHGRARYYYKENELLKEAHNFTLQTNRFATNLLENRTMIKHSVNDKKVHTAYQSLQKRSEKVARYKNVDYSRTVDPPSPYGSKEMVTAKTLNESNEIFRTDHEHNKSYMRAGSELGISHRL